MVESSRLGPASLELGTMPKAKKKKNYFRVELEIQKLLNVPYVQGHFFTKVKMTKGDSYGKTSRQPVNEHEVLWNETIAFDAKLYTDVSGILAPCFIQVSARKESDGGKSIMKLGVITIDLAEFAGVGRVERRFLLQAKTKRQGMDNSVLKIAINMKQTSGDPVFQSSSNAVRASIVPEEDVGRVPDDASIPRRRLIEMTVLDESLVKMQDLSLVPSGGSVSTRSDNIGWSSTRVPADSVIDKLFAKYPPRMADNSPLPIDNRDMLQNPAGSLTDFLLTSSPINVGAGSGGFEPPTSPF